MESLLLRGGTLVLVDKDGQGIPWDLLVVDGRIAWMGKGAELPSDAAKKGPIRVIDARGMAVMPGFVQAHVHLCQTLFRGLADDLDLLPWLRDRIWPLEAAHTEASLRASAELGLLEMARAGTTTLLDMGTVHHHHMVMEAAWESGLRVVSGKAMMDAGEGVPRGLRESTKQSLRESEALAARYRGRGGRLHYAFAPRFVLSCTEALVREAVQCARESGDLLHSHASEHPGESEAVRRILGKSDVEALRAWGMAGPDVILAHGVQLSREEMKRVARDKTRIVHCPSTNLKLGSGVLPLFELRKSRVCTALGADGAPCNNNLDPFVEMRLAALLAQARTGVGSITPKDVLRLATLDGAKALGLEHEIGSLEVGKKADLVVVNLQEPHQIPSADLPSTLVYATHSRDVVHVVVDGRWVVRHGEHVTLDAEGVVHRARRELGPLLARAGLSGALSHAR